MSTITIKIDCSNAAFIDNPDELSRILHKLADCCDRYGWPEEHGHNILDYNGNVVGTAQFAH